MSENRMFELGKQTKNGLDFRRLGPNVLVEMVRFSNDVWNPKVIVQFQTFDLDQIWTKLNVWSQIYLVQISDIVRILNTVFNPDA